MQKHRGIVLKRYMPKKQKISVLDAQLGRIEAVIRDERMLKTIWPGMSIEYMPVEGAGFYYLEHADLVAAPFMSAQQDIGFLHHMLELSYYFLEINDETPGIFPLVHFTCIVTDSLSYQQKMMVIAKFLWQLRHEVELLRTQPELQRLLALPLQGMLNERVDPHIIAHLFSWIRHAVLCHPQRAYFKTSSFIMESGVL